MVEALKDPVKVRAGQIGARRRWGPPRILRLDTLPLNVRAAIEAMVAAEEAARQQGSES